MEIHIAVQSSRVESFLGEALAFQARRGTVVTG